MPESIKAEPGLAQSRLGWRRKTTQLFEVELTVVGPQAASCSVTGVARLRDDPQGAVLALPVRPEAGARGGRGGMPCLVYESGDANGRQHRRMVMSGAGAVWRAGTPSRSALRAADARAARRQESVLRWISAVTQTQARANPSNGAGYISRADPGTLRPCAARGLVSLQSAP
jgi:hypothetical protein